MASPLRAKGAHFAHLNTRSLWGKFETFKILLEDSNLACCMLSETWLNKQLPNNLLHVPGYFLYRSDRNFTNVNSLNIKTGGGLAMYIKDDYAATDSNIGANNLSNPNLETQWLIMNKEGNKKTIIINIYRSPNGNITDFFESMQIQLQEVQKYKNRRIYYGRLRHKSTRNK